jgi:5-methylcytosine-specific restriction enzyme A
MSLFLRRCRQRGCKNLSYDTYCPNHKPASATKRGYGWEWAKLAKQVLEEEPRCAYCGAPSKIAHHIVAKDRGGSDERGNLTGVCARCHNRIHDKKGARD